ncbi:MAG: GNAT family N-acetyltransferase, partial [Lachnospiraceae bacterium]|nr:GNAT family N-acetyltransferase [Lachnospiraceae bacterium]
RTLYIDDLCVDEQCRGQHVGKALYDHACAYARQQGCRTVTKNILINLDVSVPDKDQAEIMCGHWKDRSQEIYSYVMRTLMKAQ